MDADPGVREALRKGRFMALDDHFDASKLAGNITRAPKLPVAGFWVRIIAFVVDTILLGFLLYGLSLIAREPLLAMGPWATWLAAAAIAAYFFLGDGPIGKGRTVGKLLMQIRTVDARDGGPVSLDRAAIRALILLPPYFWMQGFIAPSLHPFPTSLTEMMILGAFPLVTLGLILAQIVHVAFNPTKQGIHDVAGRTLVLAADQRNTTWETLKEEAGPVGLERIRRSRQVAWITFAVAVLFLGFNNSQRIRAMSKEGLLEKEFTRNREMNRFGVQLVFQPVPVTIQGETENGAPADSTPGTKATAEATGSKGTADSAAPATKGDESTTATLSQPIPRQYRVLALHRGDDPRSPSEIRRELERLAISFMDYLHEVVEDELERQRSAVAEGKLEAVTEPIPPGSTIVFIYQEYLDLVLYQNGFEVAQIERTFE